MQNTTEEAWCIAGYTYLQQLAEQAHQNKPMQTFEEMFIIGFFETGVSIFGPNMANPTLRYVAYKDVEYGDLVHEDVRRLEESQKHEEVCKATSYALGKHTFF